MSLLSFCSTYLKEKGCKYEDMGDYRTPFSEERYIHVELHSETDDDLVFFCLGNDLFDQSEIIRVTTKDEAALVIDTMLSILSVLS